MANILILFNLTDYAAQPWLDAGHNVLSIDLQHEETRLPRLIEGGGHHFKMGWDIWLARRKLQNTPWRRPDFIIAFPDCTQLAASGAKHWKRKAAENPRFQLDAVELAKIAADWAGAPYVIENPKGALSTLWRKPDTRPFIHPWQFGGYLPEDDVHPDYPEYIPPRDAYPKETGLWIGNGACLPEPKPVDCPPGYSDAFKKLGGKSLKTKNIRSASPRGMMQSIYEANRHLVE